MVHVLKEYIKREKAYNREDVFSIIKKIGDRIYWSCNEIDNCWFELIETDSGYDATFYCYEVGG